VGEGKHYFLHKSGNNLGILPNQSNTKVPICTTPTPLGGRGVLKKGERDPSPHPLPSKMDTFEKPEPYKVTCGPAAGKKLN